MLELLGDDPLAPLVEVNTIGELEALKLNTRRGGTSQVLGKLNRSLALNECTPQRVVGQLRAASLDEAIELALAMIRARGSEDNLKGLALSLPRAITVDQILTTSELACLVAKLLDSRARGLGQGRVFLDALGANVDRVQPPTRHRKVRRSFQRRDRLRGVNRVDEQEVRSLVGTDRSQIGQVCGIANAPRGRRPR